MKTHLLGGLTPKQFLAEYWQKKPLLIRQAIPGFAGPLTYQDVFSLACDEDVESRLIWQEASEWSMEHGPFRARDLKRRGPWTVLVQGANLFSDAASDLLHQFDFIPAARLDDLMVSYANDGGGVGPHFDSYDVFLLQGIGRRRWQISNQADLEQVPSAPLRILKNFQPTEEWVLEPGDMLYLPPQYAHNGVAEGACMTWSIGFRAPSTQELTARFFEHLAEHAHPEGRYADPDLKRPQHRAEISSEMISRVESMIAQTRWNADTIRDFLGAYLTEPKSNVFFESPEVPLSLGAFSKKLMKHGAKLHRKSQLLFAENRFFMNGESTLAPEAAQATLVTLADLRALPSGGGVPKEAVALLHEWYASGFIVLGDEPNDSADVR